MTISYNTIEQHPASETDLIIGTSQKLYQGCHVQSMARKTTHFKNHRWVLEITVYLHIIKLYKTIDLHRLHKCHGMHGMLNVTCFGKKMSTSIGNVFNF